MTVDARSSGCFRAASLAGLALLAACSTTEWVRPDTAAEVRDRDRAVCSQQAATVAERQGPPSAGDSLLSRRVGGSDRAVRARGEEEGNRAPEADRFAAQQRNMINACMEERGYQLVEVKK